jgi:hypothetical protein
MQGTTDQQYDSAIESCKDIFLKKTKDYGTSWRVYRPISIADQIYIKAKRIRNVQETGIQKIQDDVAGEFKGIVNYGIIGLIQLDIHDEEEEQIPLEEVTRLYDTKVSLTKELMEDKNHDYGEAWREMCQESFVDLILAKVLRIKQIIQNDEQTVASEGIDANYSDIINYALFALIMASDK